MAAQADDAATDAFLSEIHKSTNIVKRTLNPAGVPVSCVDVNKQPAAAHPKWPGKIQEPSEQLKAILPGPLVPAQSSTVCPTGSVQMVLPTKARILAAGGLRNFLSKHGSKQGEPVPAIPGSTPNGWGYSFHAFVEEWQTNVTAAQTTLNLWMPPVQARNFSLSQTWIMGYSGDWPQSIEAGVQVFPAVYNNSELNFFVYWKYDWRDAGSPGCSNTDCPGNSFVKTSDILPIGLPMGTASTLGGQQVERTIAWYRDPANGNWYLFNRNADGSYTASGYYPAYLFGSGQLSRYANRAMFGGEILQEGPEDTLPTVYMGSSAGYHPWYTSPLYGRVAYQRDIQVIDGVSGALRDLSPNYNAMVPNVDLTGYPRGCAYGVSAASRASPFVAGWGYSIFFGGDGVGGQGC